MKRYINDILTKILTLTLLLLAGANVAWGQIPTDADGDGYYYIINMNDLQNGHTYQPASEDNWYLCPAEGSTANLFWDGAMTQPFLTTNKEGRLDKCLWLVKKNGSYWEIIHKIDGNYLTANDYPGGNDKATRRRVHIQIDYTDDALFTLSANGTASNSISTFNIIPKNKKVDDNTKYLNPAGENRADYGPATGYYGLIGFYTKDNAGSIWYFEFVKKCVTPEISVDNGNVTITTVTSGASIYYTDDDSDPATSETKKTYTESFSLGTAAKIRAIAIKTEYDNSDEAIYNSAKCKAPTIELDKANGLTTITLHDDDNGATIYYTTDGSTPTLSSPQYYAAFTLSVEATAIKAIAANDASNASEVATYGLTQLATPTFNNNNGTLTINKPTKESNGTTDIEGPEAVVVYYNLNNTDPTTGSSQYSSSITLAENFNQNTVKARAYKPGYIKSDVASLAIETCATPTITNNFDGTVTINCATAGAKITYTYNTTGTAPNDPNPNSTVVISPLTLPEGTTHIKIRAFKSGYKQSGVTSYSLPRFQSPTIKNNNGTITITCGDGGQLFYSTSESGTPETLYSGDFSLGEATIIRAYAKHAGYLDSEIVTWRPATPVSNASDITNMSGDYVLSSGFNVDASIGTSTAPFTGTIDGQLNTLSISKPLVAYAYGATIKNVIVQLSSSISTGSTAGHVGAIVCEATGDSRIYNCGVLPSGSSTISGDGNVGGIVGNLDGNSHVINCYSFATISNGTNVGGIVGNNTKETKRTDISSMVLNSTMVMNCMFYGNITGGTYVSPIYGGSVIANDENNGLNNFNYFRQDATISGTNPIKYNCALAMEERYLERVEFFRNILNSNRELAAIYATGSADNPYDKMAKWVLDKSIANYPILKVQGKYTSIVNFDNTSQAGQETLKIHLLGTSIDVPITSKDPNHFNYNYRMVQLPYYNDYATNNYQNNQVVTGWEVSVSGKSGHQYDDFSDNNYANPNCIDKYSGRVFSQGAYFDVPEEVTEISLTPHWASCVYLSDASYDATGYNCNAATNNSRMVAQLPRYTNNTAYNINGSSQIVYTNWATAISNLPGSSTSVYDRAIVLVGNYHNSAVPPTSGTPFTIMSADLNGDNEPDYSFIYHHNARNFIMPIRFDFLNVPGTSLTQKVNGTGNIKIAAVLKPKGWFEVTNTCLIRFSQFEHNNSSKSAAPVILLGGIYEQLIASHDGDAKNTSYIHLGSNAWIKEFSDGSHVSKDNKTTHAPISITGGQFDKFYLSGMYKPLINSGANNNARCYVNGGEFDELAGAGQEQIDGDVTWQINNAHINNFYGGGINANKPITGNINITLKGGRIETFCGGPKFGDMASSKKVTTVANGTTFGTFFGAGYGGTSFYRDKIDDKTYDSNKGYNPGKTTWNGWADDYIKGKYVTGKGIAANFEYEFIDGSEDYTVARVFVNYASFSLARTNDVESTLTDCIIENNFYGGGNLGLVNGKAKSTLDGCTVRGNVFGAGFSVSIPWVDMMNSNNFVGENYPQYDTDAGVYNNETVDEEGLPGTTRYTWSSKGSVTNNSTAGSLTTDDDGNWIHTDESLTSLGTVNATELIITGDSKIGTSGITTTGHVYGGGDASAVSGNTKVTLSGNAEVFGDVFGGGNNGEVGGTATVNIQPTIE